MNSIDFSAIYRNPRIAAGYYIVKVMDVIEESTGDEHPRVQVRLKLYDEKVRGTELTSIIHSSEKCQFHHKNFIATFRIDAPHSFAIGKWGCIEVKDAEYNGTKYSSVKYICQKPHVKKKFIDLEIKDGKGEVDW
jgi:hypothetical protein